MYHIPVSWLKDATHWSRCYFTVSDPSGKAGLQSIIKGLKLLEWAFIVVVCVKVTLTVYSSHQSWQEMTGKGSDARSQSLCPLRCSSVYFVIAAPSLLCISMRMTSMHLWYDMFVSFELHVIYIFIARNIITQGYVHIFKWSKAMAVHSVHCVRNLIFHLPFLTALFCSP